MSKQPEALRLADEIEEEVISGNYKIGDLADCAAPLLRSQHALIGELVEALHLIVKTCAFERGESPAFDVAIAALAKATGEQQ